MIGPGLVGIEIIFGFELLTGQIVKRPHAFVSMNRGEGKQSGGETNRAEKNIHWNLSDGMRANGVRNLQAVADARFRNAYCTDPHQGWRTRHYLPASSDDKAH